MPREVTPDEAFDDPPGGDAPLKVWERRVLETMPPHKEVEIPQFREEHILGQGYYESVGEPRGQDGDYRRRLEDGRGLHIKDYGDRMTIHWDKVDPSVSALRHLVHDAPALTAGSLVAGAVGAAALRSVLRR
jgi:hypothetical protein